MVLNNFIWPLASQRSCPPVVIRRHTETDVREMDLGKLSVGFAGLYVFGGTPPRSWDLREQFNYEQTDYMRTAGPPPE